jgi:hypothetical protein
VLGSVVVWTKNKRFVASVNIQNTQKSSKPTESEIGNSTDLTGFFGSKGGLQKNSAII